MKTLIFSIFFQMFIILININSVYSQDTTSYHVVEVIGYIAANNDSDSNVQTVAQKALENAESILKN